MSRITGNRWMTAMASMGVILALAPGVARTLEISDNLANVTQGTEAVTADRWLAASFKTDASMASQLSSVTLKLASTSPGTAALEIRSDAGLEPGSLIATLTPPASFSATPAATTFSADGLTLDAATTYWVVLRAQSGTFEWAWTVDPAGAGVGFDPTWDVSEDAGAAWYTCDVYPLQLAVTVADGGEGTSFLRGDCNDDAAVNLSDAVCILNWLFLGEASPGCVAVANANGDSGANISDAAYLLNSLFLGGPAPVEPYPDCGPGTLETDACAVPPEGCRQ